MLVELEAGNKSAGCDRELGRSTFKPPLVKKVGLGVLVLPATAAAAAANASAGDATVIVDGCC